MQLPAYEKSAVPHFVDDYELQAGNKHYPKAAEAKNEKGYCVVHATVTSTGESVNVAITRSAGSAVLDQACIAAVKDARFTPALQDGRPAANSTDIAIYW
jgi:TonB family protein